MSFADEVHELPLCVCRFFPFFVGEICGGRKVAMTMVVRLNKGFETSIFFCGGPGGFEGSKRHAEPSLR